MLQAKFAVASCPWQTSWTSQLSGMVLEKRALDFMYDIFSGNWYFFGLSMPIFITARIFCFIVEHNSPYLFFL